MWKVDTKITNELINKFDEEDGVFYRFQNKDYDISGDYEESWGMIYSTKYEAMEDYESMDLNPEDAVLPGKSCMTTFDEIMSFISSFDSDFVLLIFDGCDTFAEGHDGEYVAEYVAPRAVIDFNEAIEFAQENLDSWK